MKLPLLTIGLTLLLVGCGQTQIAEPQQNAPVPYDGCKIVKLCARWGFETKTVVCLVSSWFGWQEIETATGTVKKLDRGCFETDRVIQHGSCLMNADQTMATCGETRIDKVKVSTGCQEYVYEQLDPDANCPSPRP